MQAAQAADMFLLHMVMPVAVAADMLLLHMEMAVPLALALALPLLVAAHTAQSHRLALVVVGVASAP